MASHTAHESSGWAAGLIAAALVSRAGHAGPFYCWSIFAFLMAYSGGTAPDWLELAWWRTGRSRKTWIQHRTWTHWGVLWVGLLVGSYKALPACPWASLAFGFAAGGVMHLLADWPNPLGVPWLYGTWRHSLNLWKSGRCDWFIVSSAWLAGLVLADRVWLEGRHTAFILTQMKLWGHLGYGYLEHLSYGSISNLQPYFHRMGVLL